MISCGFPGRFPRVLRHTIAILSLLLMAAASYDPLSDPHPPRLTPSGTDVTELVHAAAAGDAGAAFQLGVLAEKTGDLPTAFAWFNHAAEQGYHPAEAEAAVLLYRGSGTDPDPLRAAILARRAADGGDAHGQAVLGVFFGIGIGV